MGQSLPEHVNRGRKRLLYHNVFLESILKILLEMEKELHNPDHCGLQIYSTQLTLKFYPYVNRKLLTCSKHRLDLIPSITRPQSTPPITPERARIAHRAEDHNVSDLECSQV